MVYNSEDFHIMICCNLVDNALILDENTYVHLLSCFQSGFHVFFI